MSTWPKAQGKSAIAQSRNIVLIAHLRNDSFTYALNHTISSGLTMAVNQRLILINLDLKQRRPCRAITRSHMYFIYQFSKDVPLKKRLRRSLQRKTGRSTM